MPYTEAHLETARQHAVESERRVDRLNTVIGHLRRQGQSTDTAEAQLSQFHLMSRLYRERRDQIEAILTKGR